MMTFQRVLEQTERRFVERSAERAEKIKLIKEKKIIEANPPDLVRKRIIRLNADARTVNAISGEGLRFATPAGPGIAASGFPRALERVLQTNDLMSIGFFERGLQAAQSVARIAVRGPQGSLAGYGTGFMVSPRLLLTNNHVFRAPDEAAGSVAEFNFKALLDGQTTTPTSFHFAPEDFFLTDPELDFSLVALRDAPELGQFGWLRLIGETGKLMVGEKVNIIQHPNGEPKQIAVRENQVVDELELFLHYKTDTAPGSSGSPVFNDQWEVVALHHSGVPERDAQGRIVTTDGRVWADWMGEHRVAWKANEGARVSRLVARIQKESLEGDWRRLRAEMFDKQPPTLNLFRGLERSEEPKERLEAPDGVRRSLAKQDGVAIWTIPLHISVSVGGASMPLAVGGASTPVPHAVAPGASVFAASQRVQTDAASGRVEESTDLRSALAEARAARERKYYDQDTDRAAVDTYYNGVRPDAGGHKLYKALSALIASTHTTKLPYQPAKNVYPWVDIHPDRLIRSIYSGRTFEAEELIKADFKVAELREVRLSELKLTESVIGPEKLEEEIDLMEASLPFNCEHVVPQSWFAKREPMRGDIHHLFACEPRCNSFRGNTPYFDFVDFEEAVRDDCGKRESGGFEPSSGKGPVARATLYFLLRYPRSVGDADREFTKDRLPLLLEWHQKNPPKEYERHRNAAIFEMQGNRNPLIDKPEWGTLIDFSQGFG